VALALLVVMLTAVATPVSAIVSDQEAICVPWQPANPSIPHYTYSGASTTLKGIARGIDAAQYRWDYGDGSPAMDWTNIGNPYNLGATHTYTGSIGQLFIATLYVRDAMLVEVQDTYPIRIYESSDLGNPAHMDVRINMAIDEGLWWLHTNMSRSTYGAGSPGYEQPYGYWNEPRYGFPLAATGAAVDAFQLHGSRANGDYNGNPYVETVQRALNYLLANAYSTTISAQPAGNPDTNGNGKGIWMNYTSGLTNSRQTYIGGICMLALASSGAPNRVAAVGRPDIVGRTYADIVQDMVDFFAWGQVDSGGGQGGWRYYANHSSSDLSTAQWPVLGMTAAEANMGSTVPQFVRDELILFLDYVQHTDCDGNNGAFGYSSDLNYPNVTKAGAGIICHEFLGTALTDPKIESAIGYIYRNWNNTGGDWTNARVLGNSYSMYAAMKAMRIPEPDILRVTDYDCGTGSQTAFSFDWYYTPTGQSQQGLASYLVGAQQGDGQWDDIGGPNYVFDAFSTGWGVLILLKGVAIIPPVALICNWDGLEYDMGQDINLDGSCSFHPDPALNIVLYEWDFDYDGSFDVDATGMTPTITGGFPSEGYYPIALRVTDDNPPAKGGPQTSIHTATIWVHPPCHDPHADANGPYLGAIGEVITLDASGSWDPDTDSGLLSYAWDLDNDGNFDDATGVNPTHSWPVPYVGVVSVKVSDDGCHVPDGDEHYKGWDVASAIVEIGNHPPVSVPGGPYSGGVGDTVLLDGSASYDLDVGDSIVLYEWDLDNDGNYDVTGATTTSLPIPPGGGTVCLKVTDSFGLYDIACTIVAISDEPPVPVGGDVTPANKMALLAPWLVLAAAIIAGTGIVLRRRLVKS